MSMRIWITAAVALAAAAGCTAESHAVDDEIVITLPDSGPPGVCGPTVCSANEVCCNESCGICTPPGGFCTQQLCGPEAVPHLAGDHDMDGVVDSRDRPGSITTPIRTDPPLRASDWDFADPMRFTQ